MESDKRITFGPFCLDLGNECLWRGSKAIRLRPKAFAVLAYLLGRPGRLVTKEELLNAVWPETFVGDAVLKVRIRQLREALGDDPKAPRFIETAHRRGYRFIGQTADDKQALADTEGLKRQPEKDSEQEWPRIQMDDSGAYTTSKKQLPSVAILPFVNMSPDPENEYFCDGLAEELINAISRLEDLRVVARTSAFSFKGQSVDVRDVGRMLNVSAVLEGSVRKAGNRIRVAAQLVNAEDGYQLWSERYDRQMEDVFEIQDEISIAILRALRITLFTDQKQPQLRRYTANVEAYQLYLRGRYYLTRLTREDWNKAIECFKQTLHLAPDFAPAFTGFADAYFNLTSLYLSPQETMPKIREAATKALEIDPNIAEAHASLAMVSMHYDWNWSEAEQEFRRAIELSPHDSTVRSKYGLYLAFTGRFDESLAEIELAQSFDPLSLIIKADLSMVLILSRQYERAIGYLANEIEIEPDFLLLRYRLGLAYEQNGDLSRAIDEFQQARSKNNIPLVTAFLGHAYGLYGRRNEAQEMITELGEMSKRYYVSPFYVALVYLGLGLKDLVFDWLNKSCEERAEGMASLMVNPRLDSLRSDPRFQNLVSRVGLPQSSKR